MWVKAYAEDGFVIVPNLQGADTLDRLRQAMDRIMKDPKGVPEDLRHKICKVFNAVTFQRFLAQLLQHRTQGRRIILVLDNAVTITL